MKTHTIKPLPHNYFNWSCFNVNLPKNINDLLRNERDYTIVGTLDVKIPKMEKNDSLLRQSLKNLNYYGIEDIFEDVQNYYLYYQNGNMINCFSYMDLIDELYRVESEVKTILSEIHLVDYEITFNIEAYNHG